MDGSAHRDRRDLAVAWIARLRSSSVTEQDRRDFALWLAASPRNGEAFDAMADMWEDLAVVSELPIATHTPSRRNWLSGAVAMAACVLLALFIWPGDGGDASFQHYRTGLGQQQSVSLEDGSTLLLNTDSSVIVSFSAAARKVELVEGEAFFQVSNNPRRPFTVEAGSATVTAIGTAFNVYRDQRESRITVTEGVVRVVETDVPATRAAATELVYAEQQLSAGAGGLQEVIPVSTRLTLAWQRGEIIAEGMSLPELAAQLERYHDIHILITDPRVAAMTISGVFELAEPDSVLRAVALSLELEVEQLDSRNVRLLKASR
jgi:transmembrane sensor